MKQLFIAALVVSSFVASVSDAYVSVSPIFGDNMVLQRGKPIPVWGTADPGEKVAVTLGGQTVKEAAGKTGVWSVTLAALEAEGPYDLTIAGKNTLSFHNILAGEVWICSGQSNMEWPVSAAVNGTSEVASASYPKIRLFAVEKSIASKPRTQLSGSWVECSSKTVGDFSAVGYFFGRELHTSLGVPIGLIDSSWGGTPAEAWSQNSFLEGDPDFKPIFDRWNERFATYPKDLTEYFNEVANWYATTQKTEIDGGPINEDPPKFPGDPRMHPHRPAGLFNAMINPLVPYPIQGAIWYQGESNADRAYQYRKLFPTMIKSWRAAWKQEDLSFHFVQLANFKAVNPEPRDSDWAELREAQTMTLSLPKTGMAVTIDIGEANDIHPRNKQEVGRRLALAARSVTYGQDLAFSGPLYDQMKAEGDTIRITFKHANGGLKAKGDELKGFAIAGEDRKFVWAKATIDGENVVVSAEGIAQPVAVRYAWDENPVCNLYNGADLPASPFRTDDWPGRTAEKR